MKQAVVAILIGLLILPIAMSVSVRAETYVPSRTINLVYDDSGSMIRDDDYVDTWCQAKYAMEVFAGMLGENETLNIYYMSDYANGSTSAPPKLTLKGSKNAKDTERNVKKIHDLVTDASGTPFDSVKKAYKDLKKVKSDERWLVVLTDGEFNNTSNSRVQNYFDECVADGKTRVMMLSMGPNAAVIKPKPKKHIYFEKAEDTTDILSKLTSICNRIFQSNVLEIKNNNVIEFNVPMSQLVVFAQGKNVKIKGLKPSKGKTITASSNVHVQYSKVATTDKNYPKSKVIVADDLNGYVATYNTDFEPGKYTIDVTGADDIQVYYKPNVSIAAYLYNEKNEEVTAKDNLVAGTYRLGFGFVNGTNNEKVTDTSLLGDVLYEATMVNTTTGDKQTETQAKLDDTISIKEGTLDIDVTATFLDYNTVSTELFYQVYSRKDIIFTFDSKPTYILNTKGFANGDEALNLSVKIDDGDGATDLTKEQWDLLGIPTVSTSSDLGEFKVEKSDEVGTFKIYPTLYKDDPMKTEYGTIPIKVEGEFKQGLSSAQGELEDSFTINNTITTMQRILEWFKKHGLKVLLGLLALLLLLYILHIRVLPKQAHVTKRESTMFFDGEDETKTTSFSAKMDKGSMVLFSKYAGVKTGLTMGVKPGKESYLKKPLIKRSAEVDSMSVRKYGSGTISEASIGGIRYILNEDTGKLERTPPNKKPFLLRHRTPITYSGTIMNAGVAKPFTVTTKLNYKKK